MDKTRFLHVDIIGRDCAGKGLTSGKTEGILWLGSPTTNELSSNTVHLVAKLSSDTVHLVAIEDDGPTGRPIVKKETGEVVRVKIKAINLETYVFSGQMFSGQFITTSDSRFPYETPAPCHTRIE